MSQRASSSAARTSELPVTVPEPEKPSLSPFAYFSQVLSGEKQVDHVAMVLKASLFTNIIIVLAMTTIAVASHSLALLSALVENMVDLFVQGLLWYAGTRSGKKQDYAKYPAGTSRFEPVAIIVAASIMVLAAVVFIEEAISKIVKGVVHGDFEAPDLSAAAIVIVVSAVIIKIGLVFYSGWILKSTFSAAVEAIHQDNINDTMSNSIAIAAYIVAAVKPTAWYVDPAGALVIFLYIMYSWGKMAKEQVMQLVGVTASAEFIDEVKDLCSHHHPMMSLDIVRAYHFGSNYLVELEVVVPGDMSVKMAHDIALQLQFKVEKLDEVERAFVHVDYRSRDYDEHVVSREEDALQLYAGLDSGSGSTLSSRRSLASNDSYAAVPTADDVAVEITEEGPSTPRASFQEIKTL